MARKRYHSEDDTETGVTPSRLKRLGRARQLEYVLYWFKRNYEDPSNETPYESAEGGFQYVWGGPYDAHEELEAEFSGIVSESLIEKAAEEVEAEGIIDWAPGGDHPAQQARAEGYEEEDQPPPPDLDDIIRRLEAGLQPTFGDPYERRERQELIARLDRMQDFLSALHPEHGGVGHNRPPGWEEPPDPQVVEEAAGAGAAIKAELLKAVPNALAVARQTTRLKAALLTIGGLGGLLGLKAMGGAAGEIGKQVVERHPELSMSIEAIVTQAVHWLSHVTLPF